MGDAAGLRKLDLAHSETLALFCQSLSYGFSVIHLAKGTVVSLDKVCYFYYEMVAFDNKHHFLYSFCAMSEALWLKCMWLG